MGTKACLCCSGSRKIRRGLWSPDEDARLKDYIQANGIKSWTLISVEAGLDRCGKSCRLRWLNYLRPNLKRGKFSMEEQQLIVRLQSHIGNRWSFIAKQLPGRTDNEVKNFWNAKFKGIHNVQEIGKIKLPDPKHNTKLDSASLAQNEATSSFSSMLNYSKKHNFTRTPLFSCWWSDSHTYHVPQYTKSLSHVTSETLLYDQQHVQHDDSYASEENLSDMSFSCWTPQCTATVSSYDLITDLLQWTNPVMEDMD